MPAIPWKEISMKPWALAAFILLLQPLFGAEYEDGHIRLVLNSQPGRFSLYYLTDPSRRSYEPLFMDQDPRTSVLTLSWNGKTYRLGESRDFTVSEGGTPQNPALIFESSFAKLTQEFSFIATGSSDTANGVRITFLIENKSWRRAQAGLRLLLDTKLGETSFTPFTTAGRSIEDETLVDSFSFTRDRFWVSGSPVELALMGSISSAVDRVPDRIHIANWKRLNDVPWSLDFVQGRNFNYPPYSIRDSALAYYYEPVRINRGESDSFYLLLASWDARDFKSVRSPEIPRTPPAPDSPDSAVLSGSGGFPGPGGEPPVYPPVWEEQNRIAVPPAANPAILRSDYNALLDIIERVDACLEAGVPMNDEEISGIELDLDRIRSRYGGP
jgi:hypothetical protein